MGKRLAPTVWLCLSFQLLTSGSLLSVGCVLSEPKVAAG